jgi:lipopolysaccharide/colanic/teichoic acid biosynthesis glycosyltransferase
VRPGLTGPWQISADRPGYAHENLHYDERYLASVSLRTDLAILLRTPLALTRGR